MDAVRIWLTVASGKDRMGMLRQYDRGGTLTNAVKYPRAKKDELEQNPLWFVLRGAPHEIIMDYPLLYPQAKKNNKATIGELASDAALLLQESENLEREIPKHIPSTKQEGSDSDTMGSFGDIFD